MMMNRCFAATTTTTTTTPFNSQVPQGTNHTGLDAAAAAKAVIPLIDPTFRGGLIEVPFTKTFDTKGRTEWIRGSLTKDLSLCCLFQKGRCSLQERCHQIHVDTVYVAAVRQQHAHVVSCCRRCRDTASLTSAAISFFAERVAGTQLCVAVAAGVEKEVDVELVAYTVGLPSILDECRDACAAGRVVVPTRKVCRLHLASNCKYGKDCKYLHLCTQLGPQFLEAPQSSQPFPMRAPQAQPAATGIWCRVPTPAAPQPANPWTVRENAAPTVPPQPAAFRAAVYGAGNNAFFDRVQQQQAPLAFAPRSPVPSSFASSVSSGLQPSSRSSSIGTTATSGSDAPFHAMPLPPASSAAPRPLEPLAAVAAVAPMTRFFVPPAPMEEAVLEESFKKKNQAAVLPAPASSRSNSKSNSPLYPHSNGSSVLLESSGALGGLCFDATRLFGAPSPTSHATPASASRARLVGPVGSPAGAVAPRNAGSAHPFRAHQLESFDLSCEFGSCPSSSTCSDVASLASTRRAQQRFWGTTLF